MNQSPQHLYLDLLKRTLSFTLWPEPPQLVTPSTYEGKSWKRSLLSTACSVLKKKELHLCKVKTFSDEQRNQGRVWPGYADTMIGLPRLDNLQQCIETVLEENVPGDLIETGAWRGGSCIFMRAALKAYGDSTRKVFVADSFEGLPKPNAEEYPADAGDPHHTYSVLAVSMEDVENNFRRYSLLDDKVVFLKGWFKDTLPDAPIEKLSILRLDGDMYESTMDALTNLYPKLSTGGYCIVDDFAVPGCEKAITDYRSANAINCEIQEIDWTGRFWRKEA